MTDLHAQIMNIPCDDKESLDYKRGHRDARHAAAELSNGYEDVTPAAAAIKFAVETDDMDFLRLWNEADFEALRQEWPEAPEEVFQADALYGKRKD